MRLDDLDALDPLLVRKTGARNQYLALPQGFGADEPDVTSTVFAVPVAVLERETINFIEAQPRIKRLDAVPTKRLYLFAQRTPVLRFVDRIAVHVIEIDETRSSLGIYSKARIGVSDFGVNARRVHSWLDGLRAAVARV